MRGYVAAGSAEAAEAGAQALRAGGNAVDAAVAAMFTAFIAEPTLSSPGGAGIALVHAPRREEAETFDFFAAVPGLPATSLDPTGIEFAHLEIDFGSSTTQPFHVGRGATAVPGCIPGLLELHRRDGRLPLASVLETPERLAREGVTLSAPQAGFISLLAPIIGFTPELARAFGAHSGPARAGDVLRHPAWADALAWIREQGTDPLTRGFLREELLAHWGPPRGLLTAEDLDRYQTSVGRTHYLTYRDHRILLPGYPSVGGAMVGLALKLLEEVELPADPYGFDRLHVLACAQETALHARADCGVVAAGETLEHWLAPERIERYRRTFRALLRRDGTRGDGPAGPQPGNTTHVSAVDESGLAATVTTSNGESCGAILPGLGLPLNNFLGEEDINPLGWHREPPGKRLATMMCPTVVQTSDGRHLALGTGGSKRIRSAIAQVIVNLLDYRMPPRQAVEFPRIHRELDGCFLEGVELPATTLAAFAAHFPGGCIFSRRDVYFGGVHLASLGPDGALDGAGDRRRGGAVAVSD